MDRIKKPRLLLLAIAVIAIISLYIAVALLLPFRPVQPTLKTLTVTAPNTGAITWPTYGQQALGAAGTGVLAANGTQTGVAIGSIAKLVLALSVMEQKPFTLGEPGPVLTMTDQDVAFYKKYLAQNGSVVPVQVNETLTESQMLQALLLPSGDNIADSLAVWAFGSTDNYLKYASDLTNRLALKQTHLADTSGLSPQSVSSATDLVVIGENVLKQPVLASIVSQSQATLPVVGVVKNIDSILGQQGIVGIKTGSTDQAGGCFLFASQKTASLTIIGAILNAPNLSAVLHDTITFLKANSNVIQPVTVVSAGQVVGSYQTPWGKAVNVVAKSDLTAVAIGNQTFLAKASLTTLAKPTPKDTVVGQVTVESGSKTQSVDAVLESSLTKPGRLWRLLHP